MIVRGSITALASPTVSAAAKNTGCARKATEDLPAEAHAAGRELLYLDGEAAICHSHTSIVQILHLSFFGKV